MKHALLLAGASFFVLSALPAHADTSDTTTTTTTTTVWYVPSSVEMRAGPDMAFPVVDNIPTQAHMSLNGCLVGWSWCDVNYNGKRGWVEGKNVETNAQEKTVYITDVGPTMHVPVETYDTTAYWDTYYKTEPFYTKRQEFITWKPAQ